MRHLIDPLDFTQQEITTLLDLADRIHDDPAAYHPTPTCATGASWPPCSMSRPPAPAFRLRPPC